MLNFKLPIYKGMTFLHVHTSCSYIANLKSLINLHFQFESFHKHEIFHLNYSQYSSFYHHYVNIESRKSEKYEYISTFWMETFSQIFGDRWLAKFSFSQVLIGWKENRRPFFEKRNFVKMEMIGRLNALALDNENLVCVLKQENRMMEWWRLLGTIQYQIREFSNSYGNHHGTMSRNRISNAGK